MTTISLQLKDEVLDWLRAEALQEGLSLEDHIEARLNDWYALCAPMTPDEHAGTFATPERMQSSWERLKRTVETLF